LNLRLKGRRGLDGLHCCGRVGRANNVIIIAGLQLELCAFFILIQGLITLSP
jgi:hypothetical protein